MKRLIFLSILFFIGLSEIEAQNIGQIPYSINLDLFATGFSTPVDITNAGDDRLFVVERIGRIQILNQDGSINPVPFLDINPRVINNSGQSEQGLLAMEFHHDYLNTGWFFVHYIGNDGNTVISRFEVDANNPDIANPASESIIFTLQQPFGNHNGGSIKFGPDNMLYIGMGDGGSANDPENFSQNPNSFLGKMIRIDVDNGLPFSIPTDNPFVNSPDTLDAIWALGVRNPWKFSFDNATGDLWIGDVGQNEYEEINFQSVNSAGGENYGWRCREGNNDNITSGCVGPFEPAAVEVPHTGTNHCSITGGYVYRGNENMFGSTTPIYLFADYCSSAIFGAYPESNGTSDFAFVELDRFQGNGFGTFGEDSNGELYIAAANNGRIFRINAECNIEIDELEVNAASCVEASDGAISLPSQYVDLFDIQVVDVAYPSNVLDANNLPPGNYEVTISRFGCERVFLEEVVQIEQAPVQIEFDPITNIATASSDGVIFRWFIDGELITEGSENQFRPSIGGSFILQVEIIQANGCVLISEEELIIISSTNELKLLTDFQVSPNPVKDILTVELLTDRKEELSLTIIDATGRVFQTHQHVLLGEGTYTFNLKELASGVYFILVSNGEIIQSKRVVKQ